MSLGTGEAAAITALQNALNNSIGVDDSQLQIATDIIALLKTWITGSAVDGTAGGDPIVGGALS